MEDYQGAIEDFKKTIKINPNAYDAYNNLGESESRINNIDSALFYFNKALEINPRFGDALNNKGKGRIYVKKIPGINERF